MRGASPFHPGFVMRLAGLRMAIPIIAVAAVARPAMAHCPDPTTAVAGNFRVWVLVHNVGTLGFIAKGPHYLSSLESTSVGWFSSTLMVASDAGGRVWGAEGPWKASCVHLFGGVHTLVPFGPPGNFQGTVFLIGDAPQPPPDGDGDCDYQIIPDPETCDPSGDGGAGGGGDGGGGGGGVGGENCIVEYVCIDIWNEETGGWEEYWCGDATVCG